MQANCDFKSEIVISGISGRFPKSANLDEFWQNLVDGTDMVGDANERYNVDEYECSSRMALLNGLDKFDSDFFAMHARQASALDPRIKQLLEVTYETIIDAGLHPVEIQGSNTGVFAALGDSAAKAIVLRSCPAEKINKYALQGHLVSIIANRLSFFFNLHGPSYVVDTACSSSIVAIQQALQAIRNGNCDAAIVASAHTQHDPAASQCFHQSQMTSPDGKCKSFDASADGFVRAEAVAAIYICKKQVAKRSYATLVHAATNSDGYKEQGITFPSEVYQEKVIRQVYRDSGVNPLDVDYIEAHGTGTKVGDPQEISAVCKVFCEGRKGPLLVGSVKSNMGHPEPVAGLCGIAKVILAHLAGVLPANLHYHTPNPDIPALLDGRIKVVDKNQQFNAKYVALNSTGAGGTNVHLLMKLDARANEPIWFPPVPVILLASGRTQEGVNYFLEKARQNCKNHSFVGLTHEITKNDTPRHPFRGYAIMDLDNAEIYVEERDAGRKLWYIITGLGSQWPGMSRDLIKFEVFKKSIDASAQVLLKNNFDILSLLISGDTKTFEDFKTSDVSVTTIQVALIQLLHSIGMYPDGIVGHSTGEVASAYADGCLSHEQTILTSYARVRAVLESNLMPGTVASVGLTWDDAKQRCPPGIWPVIHNAEENVTIAGSPEDVRKFTKQLEGEGIFAKLVKSASFGFHSPMVEESGKLSRLLLEEIITNPKIRSEKWLSTSVPESQWGTDLAKYCSADYYVNNALSPVYFYPIIKHVPEHIVALEIGPHCFFQSILKKSLSNKAVVLGLIHVKSPDNCVYFLSSIGKCYLSGINVTVAFLYEPITFPVPATTPAISPLIRWDHSELFVVPHHANEISRQKGVKFTFNLSNEQDSFLDGHKIDGKTVFPATGYIWLVWRCFAQQNGSRIENFPVVFENVCFGQMTVLSKEKDTELLVNILASSGKFEITEFDNLVCSGFVRNVDKSAAWEMLPCNICIDQAGLSGPFMIKEDFYKELHIRGYGHSGLFQGIEETHFRGEWAKAKWQGNWVSFIDAVLQTCLLQNEDRELYLHQRMLKLTIEPNKIMECLQANDSIINIKSWEKQKTTACDGIEIRGLKFSKLNQKSRQSLQATVEQTFLPYLGCPQLLSECSALECTVEIAMDNLPVPKMICVEILKSPANMIAHRIVKEAAYTYRYADSSPEFFLVNTSDEAVKEENISASMSKVITMEDLQNIDYNIVFTDDKHLFDNARTSLKAGALMLFKGASGTINQNPRISVMSEKSYLTEGKNNYSYYLVRNHLLISNVTNVIDVDAEEFSWIETAKTALNTAARTDRIYFVSNRNTSGLLGFLKCLVQEYTLGNIRCYHSIQASKLDFSQPSNVLKFQIQMDLVYNIFINNVFGAICRVSITKEEFWKKTTSSVAYANALTLGDMSSISWIDSPVKIESKDLIKVHYSSLNFKDVMLASGKIVQDDFAANYDQPDCLLGFEFAGVFQGRRVFGSGQSGCLATQIDPNNKHLFNIHESWTFEEAATVPCVYGTAYIALILRGKMKPGESILIHAGSGGVGQAAIQIALSMNCRVFTTVSTNRKQEFLKARFPALTEDCFTSSRDAAAFEYHINEFTNGRGVDLVLNCLAQDKLQASIRCLAINGRLLEIGKYDILNDTSVGMSMLAKGVSVNGIVADQMQAGTSLEELGEIRKFIIKSNASGLVNPLSYHVFQHNQLQEAFRFMAQGKHIGKVIIQIKNAENLPATVSANPASYFYPYKSYIIVGGLGGMGFELANWLIKRGTKHLILSSRSGKTSSYHNYHISLWKQNGVNVVLENSDVSKLAGANKLLETAKTFGPIGGIFNTALLLIDAMFDNQSVEDFQEVARCKADATLHLDAASRQLAPNLNHFVVFSSLATSRGNFGHTSYGFANSVMERICENRKDQGLPALAIQWGAVGDVGAFHRLMKDKESSVLAPQSIKSCLETLDIFLQRNHTVVSSYIPYYRRQTSVVDFNDSLVNMAANILGIKEMTNINLKTPLVEFGLDSLMAAELGQVLSSRLNLQMSQKDILSLCFERLAQIDSQKSEIDGNSVDKDVLGVLVCSKVCTLKKMPENPLLEMKSLKTFQDKVFVFHPIDGSVQTLEDLVSQLDATVFGLECSAKAPLDSIETLAEYYLNQIQEIQPTGPYKMVGYSFGANVAFEIALKLEKQNQTVAALILLDGSPRWNHYMQTTSLMKIKGQEWINWYGMVFLSYYLIIISPSVYKELKEIETVEGTTNYVASQLHQINTNLSLAEIKDLVSSFIQRAKCVMKYSPNDKVKAKTVLLKAVESTVGNTVDYDYGLSEVCVNQVQVIEIQGNHCCFYEKPDELGLAEILNNVLS